MRKFGFKIPVKQFAGLLSVIIGISVISYGASANIFSDDKKKEFEVQKTEKEWKEQLSDEEYRVLRKAGTEPAFSSPLNNEKRTGTFICAACDHPLYPSSTKFDSGTGWPSFYAPAAENSVETSVDFKLIYPRTEVHCARCGGHLGHVFKDGPEPTGLRHCINGVALDFVPDEPTSSTQEAE